MRTIAETLQPDVPDRIRQRFGSLLTRLARALGQPEYRIRRYRALLMTTFASIIAIGSVWTFEMSQILAETQADRS